MRLLKLDLNGEVISSTTFVGDDIPPYAILSHTWGADAEEFSFRDLIEGTGRNRAGYHKVKHCGEQAKHDNLQYFWADTCCIDKSNSVELQEAINSMFLWYQNAAKCYVFLADVSCPPSDILFEAEFCKSRWFVFSEVIFPSRVFWEGSDTHSSLFLLLRPYFPIMIFKHTSRSGNTDDAWQVFSRLDPTRASRPLSRRILF